MRRPLLLVFMLGALPVSAAQPRDHAWCGKSRWGTASAVAAHLEQVARYGGARAAAVRASFDVGNVAVLQDQGDLVLSQNFVDVQGAGLQFSPSGTGYGVTRADRPVTAAAGTSLPLTDDSSQLLPLPFAFSFFGKSYSEVYVNSDGNLTFGAADSASDARSLGRFLGGPPRIAPLFTDLDPGVPGASIAARSEADRFSVVWTKVPLFGSSQLNTFEVTLYADGRVDFVYDKQVANAVGEGVIGIAPGANANGFTPADFSTAAGLTAAGAIGESFRDEKSIDTVSVALKFYQSHGDDYHQLVVFTAVPALGRGSEAFAYEQTVHNTDTGIVPGESSDRSASYGSAGRLESFVMMDFVYKYSADPSLKILREDTSLGVLAHEVGHRWLASALFKDPLTGAVSEELLGRQKAHWSFFVQTFGSHLEGNDIQDLGGGQFKTVGAGTRYSPLDQYLMGLRAPEEVPPFFFVRNPAIPNGSVDPTRSPEVGVSFSGTRQDLTIAEVIAAMGTRNPASGARPPFRQAFIYVSIGEPATAQAIAVVEALRSSFEAYFTAGTDGRGAVDTHLN